MVSTVLETIVSVLISDSFHICSIFFTHPGNVSYVNNMENLGMIWKEYENIEYLANLPRISFALVRYQILRDHQQRVY